MFGSNTVQSMSVIVGDPAADNKQIPLWRAPVAAEILRAYVTVQNAQGSGSAGTFALLNYGTGGTAVSGTVAAGKGGTAVAARLSALTPTAYTLTDGTLAAGEWLVLDYQEVGDFTEGNVAINFDYVLGLGV